MYKSKRFTYEYEEWDEGGKGADTMISDIMADSEFDSLEEIVIGCWGEAWEPGSQQMIDEIVANADAFSHIRSLYIGDMDFEDCEASWIVQADYSKLWDAMPQLESITIKGSTDLTLGLKSHANLQSLTIICGGLPTDVIEDIQAAVLPSLKKLLLYVGVEDYGFDGDIQTIRTLLEKSDFSGLEYLGITDSERQNEIAKVVLESPYADRIVELDLSSGVLTDEGGTVLLNALPNHANIKKVNLNYHFMTEEMMEKLSALAKETGVEITMEEPQEYDDYAYPMLTE